MPKLRVDLDSETFEALVAHATAERRPAPLQAEVILRQALGLPFPFPATPQASLQHMEAEAFSGNA